MHLAHLSHGDDPKSNDERIHEKSQHAENAAFFFAFLVRSLGSQNHHERSAESNKKDDDLLPGESLAEDEETKDDDDEAGQVVDDRDRGEREVLDGEESDKETEVLLCHSYDQGENVLSGHAVPHDIFEVLIYRQNVNAGGEAGSDGEHLVSGHQGLTGVKSLTADGLEGREYEREHEVDESEFHIFILSIANFGCCLLLTEFLVI